MKTLINDDSKLGAKQAAQELSLTSLAAVWKTCSSLQENFAARRAKMEEDPTKVPEIPGDDHAEFREQFVGKHPDVLLPPHREPHRKLVGRIQRDFLVHGAVPFYQVGEFRTRSEQIVQKSGISKTADDLIKVVAVDQPVQAASEAQVLDKLHAFFVGLEYLNICEFTVAAGPLKYLSELEEWRHENRGLALLLTVDTLIRKKVHRLNHDRRKEFSTFSKALVEVLTNHKQIWNDARSSAELDKFKQAGHQDPATPVRSAKRSRSLSDNEESPAKLSPKKNKNKARRERQKNLLAKAKAALSSSAAKKPTRDDRIPEKEWKVITGFKYSGKRRPTVPAQAPVWKSWSDVPSDVHEVAKWGPWWKEIFFETARLTRAFQAVGLLCLPPIDITVCEMVPQPFDVVDVDRWSFFMQLVYMGAICYAHFGTPCNTYSAARKDDGGPPPLP
eukprot:symbB.v1.2.005546.t1/scaffold308.1/size235111/9